MLSAFFFSKQCCPGGGIGRHAGLKILWSVRAVTVQLRSWVLLKAAPVAAFIVIVCLIQRSI